MDTSFTNKPCRIFAEALEETALEQFRSAMAQDFVVAGALMPDAHTGYSLPIGAVVATDGVILPSWVGYDIGCGMAAIKINCPPEWIRYRSELIFDLIYRAIPTGFAHNVEKCAPCVDLPHSPVVQEQLNGSAWNQIGSLGSGNHFIEIGEDAHGHTWAIVHSGSRNLGHKICTHYMKLASGTEKPLEGHFGFAADSPEGRAYIEDMNFCLAFALANRKEILRRVAEVVGGAADWDGLINRNHNHAELRDGLWIHRKGATHAEEGMLGVIPGNMRDGSFIVRGKGNHASLWSSSHGAGRVMGRKQAGRTFKLDDFTQSMSGITAKVCSETLDESPFCYKDIFTVMEQQKDLIEVLTHVKPIINVKGVTTRKDK